MKAKHAIRKYNLSGHKVTCIPEFSVLFEPLLLQCFNFKLWLLNVSRLLLLMHYFFYYRLAIFWPNTYFSASYFGVKNCWDVWSVKALRITVSFKANCTWAMPWLRRLITGLSPRRPDSRLGQCMWDLWWEKWHWDSLFSEFFSFPHQYHSTVALSIHISSGGWKISPLVAAVQRHHLTPSTWTTAVLEIMLVMYLLQSILIAIS
jgi:hypothetical protein